MQTFSEARPGTPKTTASRRSCIRVMLVDDSLTVRTAFSRMIEDEGDIEVAASLPSAESAIMQLRRTEVDVIVLDLEMPGMGGLKALPHLLKTATCAQVLVVSAFTEEGAEQTLAALSMGAADTMLKPRPGQFDDHYRHNLIARIRALSGEDGAVGMHEIPPPKRQLRNPGKRPELIAIGASTGGIHALNQYVRALPPACDLPILVTQHLPTSFIPVFARQLEMTAARETLVADQGLPIRRGSMIVAPGHGHMIVRKKGEALVCDLSYDPAPSGCMPSVDTMLESIAEACDGAALGIMLSGMGRDGSVGARRLVEAGGTVFAQDEATSAVWGMPRSVIDSGTAAEVGPPELLAKKSSELAGAASWT